MTLRRYFTHSLLVFAALLVWSAAPARADTIVLQTSFEADTPGTKPPGSIIGLGGVGSGFTTSGSNVSVEGTPRCATEGFSSPQCLLLRFALALALQVKPFISYEGLFNGLARQDCLGI